MKNEESYSPRKELTFLATGAIWLVAGALWASIGAGVAQAGADEKHYPATTCRPGDSYTNNFGVGKGMHIYNKSKDEWLVVRCPIIRDIADISATFEWVRVNYKNPNYPEQKFACQVETRRPVNSEVITKRYAEGTSTTSNGLGTLYIPVPAPAWNQSTYYMLNCFLPPNKGKEQMLLLDYRVRETD